MLRRIDTSIFSLRTFLCPTETRWRPLGCLSIHVASVRRGSHLRGHADFLTVHRWIKALREMKNQTLWGQDVTDGLHDVVTLVNILLVSCVVPGARAAAVALSLGQGTADWMQAWLQSHTNKLQMRAERRPFSVEDALVWMFGPDRIHGLA